MVVLLHSQRFRVWWGDKFSVLAIPGEDFQGGVSEHVHTHLSGSEAPCWVLVMVTVWVPIVTWRALLPEGRMLVVSPF